jgi:serine/threonine-protein kinase
MARLNITPHLHPGYRLRHPCGSGGFGEVWAADKDTGGAVALKFMRCTQDQGAAGELRSIQVVQELPHAHLIRIDRVWCAAEYLVVAMELADGSLTDLLEICRADVGTALPPRDLLPLLAQAAKALDFLNNRQHLIHGQWLTVQHCDVTPSNLLLFGDSIKLSDFGLTTTLAARQKLHRRAGTPAYAAPEVFQGLVSNRTDQYALAVCYCLLRGGRLPFPDTPPRFLAGYVRPAPDLSMLAAAEQPVVARALAVTPQDRWPSSRELIEELQRVTAPPSVDGPSGHPLTEQTERRREPRHRPEQRIDCDVLATLGNQAWEAEVQNISQGGVRLRIPMPGCDLQPGRLLELVLTNQLSGARHPARLRLAHGARLPNGDYEVGGAFVQPLTDNEMFALTQATQAPAEADRELGAPIPSRESPGAPRRV